MKTLIELTDKSAKYEFASGTAKKIFTISNGPQVNDELIKLDFEAIAQAEYEKWIEWVNSSQSLDENGIEIR